MYQFKWVAAAVAVGVLSLSGQALAADDAPGAKAGTTVGGHVGLAVPLVTFADRVTAIGADFTKFGLAPGVTVKLDQRWAIDFEMVAYSNFHGGGNVSTLVIDPGVIYNFDALSVGLRTAVHVGQTQNWGLIPIILKGFPIGDAGLKFFVEMDFPLFFDENGVALTLQPQMGIAF